MAKSIDDLLRDFEKSCEGLDVDADEMRDAIDILKTVSTWPPVKLRQGLALLEQADAVRAAGGDEDDFWRRLGVDVDKFQEAQRGDAAE